MSERESSFFAELKRRNVIRMAGLYLVGAWLLIQVASTVLPAFDVPSWALRGLIITLVLGFFPALIFSWVFELTPQGLKRDEDVAPGQSIAPQTARRMDRMIIAVLALALGYFGFDKWVLTPRREAAQSHPALMPNESPSTANAKSIAVLPFESLSEDKANAYFADGIQDEILTRLSKIADLKVISRTSTQKYKSAPDNLREIAHQLGVSNILEGSVQKASEQVRVSVQLIDARNDSHLWAESYDRKISDVFQVESDVAEKIAASLEAKLTGMEKHDIASVGTKNSQAYDQYLRALAIYHEDNYDARMRSLQALEEAVRIDPDFAAAWALLARMETLTYSYGDRTAGRAVAARTALETALRLQPDLPETRIAKGLYEERVLADYDSARRTFESLHSRWPNNADVAEALGGIALVQGDRKNGRNYLNTAIGLNPRDLVLRREAAYVRMGDRDFAAALRVIDEALEISPDDPNLFGVKAEVYQALGQLDEADALLNRLNPKAKNQDAVLTSWYQAVLRHGHGPAISLMRTLSEPSNSLPVRLQSVYLIGLGELERLRGEAKLAEADYTHARALLEAQLKEQPDNPWTISALAQAYAGLGNREVALREADRAVNVVLSSRDASFAPFHEEIRARIQARFGEADAAIANLRHLLSISYRGPFGPPLTPALLRLDPYFDGIRSDPRFQELCRDKLP
jgi:TolB-like protein